MIKSIGLGAAAILSSFAVNAAESVIKVESHYSVQETADRFENIAKSKGLNVFARIDHQKNAEGVDLELRPTQLIIFGNPQVGTLLMQCQQSMGLDLPLKVLVTEDENKQVWLSYYNPQYLKAVHQVEGCDEVITKVSGVLGALSAASTTK
jgi:uncharacterized protein (DUF302 family)